MAEVLTAPAPATPGTIHRRTVLAELRRGKDGAITVSVSSEMPVDRGGYREVLDGAITVSVSSEMPVDRGGYREVLDHGPSAVDLRRARQGLPLLLEHDREKHIGRASNIRLENRKLRAELRPGRSRCLTRRCRSCAESARRRPSAATVRYA